MKNTILIHTQYEENYAHYEGGFHWKKKGGHTFQIEMDADLLMYTDPAEVFGKMLESQNSDIERFTYVEYEIQWQKPTLLGTQEDYVKANQGLEDDTEIQDSAVEVSHSSSYWAIAQHDEEVNHIIAGVDFSEDIKRLNNLSL